MPVAVSYKSRATASTSSGRAGRIRGASGKSQGLADAVLERRRLPAELLLSARRIGSGVPEQELELAAGDEWRDPGARRERVACGGNGARERHRHDARHASAVSYAHHGSSELVQGDVTVGEDVALAVAPALGHQE